MDEHDFRLAIRLNAGNDRNGNPRRVYVILDSRGNVTNAIDEGYNGTRELEKAYPHINPSGVPTFQTTPKEYRELLSQFGKGDN